MKSKKEDNIGVALLKRSGGLRDRPFNMKGGGVWFFVSFRIFFSDNTRVRIFTFFIAQNVNFFSRIKH